MFLQKIEIQGFKSFAQKTTLEFPRPSSGPALVSAGGNGSGSIACIVGPNGAGKSNVVDAIRWVLGEQSLKSLRGRKSQDVIFSGSEKRNQLGLASVALYINNEDGTLPLDYEEVVISRKLYRNGESDYRINKSAVRLQDVLMLVAQGNFGQKSYSIISQGSIDRVIMASPADRKDYFDEAVGVKQFQLKRDSSLNKLESAWNNLRQVDALLTEIKPRLGSLTRQVKRLERREQVEAELRAAQHQHYGSQHHQLRLKIDELKPRLSAQEAELRRRRDAVETLQRQFAALEKEESRSSAFSSLQQHYQKIFDEKNKRREAQLLLQNKIELAKQRRSERTVPLPLSDILRKLKEIDRLEATLRAHLDTGDAAAIAKAQADVQQLFGLLRQLIGQLENPCTPATPQSGAVDPALLKELKAVETELAATDKRLEQARQAIEQFNQQEEKKKSKFFALQRDITKQQSGFHQFSQTVSELRVEMARLETRQQDVVREIQAELGDTGWLKTYTPAAVQSIQGGTEHRRGAAGETGEVSAEISRLKRQLDLIGGVDPEVAGEYAKVKERHDFLDEQAEDLRVSIKSLEKVINDLDDNIQVQFDTAFHRINQEFSKFFKVLFGGGKAGMVLIKEDPSALAAAKPPTEAGTDAEAGTEEAPGVSILDQLAVEEERISPKRMLKKRTGKVITGIDISATPPGKKVSSITMLSGGERSLTSIALICAIISNNPSPFVILDEVDAALDEANSQRFSKILEELAHRTQFIVITHNRATMQRSNILYGITMGDDGVSRLLSLKLEEAMKVVRQ